MSNKSKNQTRAATGADVTAGYMDFHFGGSATQMVGAQVSVKLADGSAKAWDGKAVITGARLRVDNTGAVDFADTDVVTVSVH